MNRRSVNTSPSDVILTEERKAPVSLREDGKGCRFKEGPRPVSRPWLCCYFRRRRRCMRTVTVIAVVAAIITVNVMINISCLLSPKR